MATRVEQAVLDAAREWAQSALDSEQHGGEHQAKLAETSAALFEAVMALEAPD